MFILEFEYTIERMTQTTYCLHELEPLTPTLHSEFNFQNSCRFTELGSFRKKKKKKKLTVQFYFFKFQQL